MPVLVDLGDGSPPADEITVISLFFLGCIILSICLLSYVDVDSLPECRFHYLRHLCASIMLMQGVNVKVAQEHLGHKDITTTMNIYSHVLPSVAKEAAQKIGSLVYDAG